MAYVDGFVMVAPKKNIPAYRAMATKAGKVWMKYGALQYVECVGEDLKAKNATLPFPKMVSAKAGETVIFSFIMFKSRKHRDTVNAKVMKDPFMDPKNWKPGEPMPFDMERVGYGGFDAIVNL